MTRYVVGYTDTPAGHDALAFAERLARRSGSELDIVLVVPDLPVGITPPDATYDRYVDTAAERWLARADNALDPSIIRRTHTVRSDSAPAALLEAVKPDARLLIVGLKKNPFGHHALGNISSALLHTAGAPVAVVPEGTQLKRRGKNISRITAFLGTRPGASLLLDTAIDLAHTLEVPLRIVSLVTLNRMDTHAEPDEVIERAARLARESDPDLEVSTHTGEGQGVEDAVRATDWDRNELALVGSSRLAQPRRLFIGSTATKVSRVLPVPLIVTPSAEGAMTSESPA